MAAGGERAAPHLLDRVVHGHVDPLQHRRQDQRLLLGARGQVLIRVDPDRQLVRLDRRVEQPGARRARRVVDDLGAVVVHLGRERLALDRVVEGAHVSRRCTRRAPRCSGSRPARRRCIPASNFWISGPVWPPRKPIVSHSHLSAAAAPTRNEPSCSLKSKSATFVEVVVVEPARGAARGVPVHDHEVGVRVVRRRSSLMSGENANPTPITRLNPASASACTFAVAVRTRGVGLVRDHVLLADEAVGDRLLQAGVGRVVEGLVTETADVERDADLDVGVALGAGRARGARLAGRRSRPGRRRCCTPPPRAPSGATARRTRKKRLRMYFPPLPVPCPAGSTPVRRPGLCVRPSEPSNDTSVGDYAAGGVRGWTSTRR